MQCTSHVVGLTLISKKTDLVKLYSLLSRGSGLLTLYLQVNCIVGLVPLTLEFDGWVFRAFFRPLNLRGLYCVKTNRRKWVKVKAPYNLGKFSLQTWFMLCCVSPKFKFQIITDVESLNTIFQLCTNVFRISDVAKAEAHVFCFNQIHCSVMTQWVIDLV